MVQSRKTPTKAAAAKTPAASKTSASTAKSHAKTARPVAATAGKSAAKNAVAPGGKSPAKESRPGPAGKRKPVSAEQRRHYIEVAAYYRAERRSFDGADPAEDWILAEIEVDRLLAEGKLNP